MIPTAGDNAYWTNYQFSGGATPNQVRVTCITTNTTNVLGPPYSGYVAVGSTFQIIANAQNLYSTFHIMATVGQQVLLGQIPIFQFAIFYNDTMELDPGAPMNITGMVHGNTNIYVDPSSMLTFFNDVSATGILNLSEDPLDPSSRTTPTPTNIFAFNGAHLSDVIPLILPVGTNTQGNTTNVGANAYAILQVPPPGESPTSSVGTNRLYNQADMIITISNGNVINVTSGVAVNNQATVITNWSSFISTNGSFVNMRDANNAVDPVDINVGALRQWSATNNTTINPLRPLLAALRGSSEADVQSVYVADQRFMSNLVVITNYSYTTNTVGTNTTSYPTGSYVPPVTTNTSQTTGSTYPANGTFVPPILSTNTTPTTSSTHPNSGTYVGTITTNGSYPNRTYTYNKITGYIYNGITGYTYAAITGIATNTYLTTNYVQYAEPGIVLTNGGTLPANGLSVVTPDPAYIVGNWNVTNNNGQGMINSANVVDTLPSAIYADAVTILSQAWTPRLTTGGRQPDRHVGHGQRGHLDGHRSLQRDLLQRRGGKLPALPGELERGQFLVQRFDGANVHQPDCQLSLARHRDGL